MSLRRALSSARSASSTPNAFARVNSIGVEHVEDDGSGRHRMERARQRNSQSAGDSTSRRNGTGAGDDPGGERRGCSRSRARQCGTTPRSRPQFTRRLLAESHPALISGTCGCIRGGHHRHCHWLAHLNRIHDDRRADGIRRRNSDVAIATYRLTARLLCMGHVDRRSRIDNQRLATAMARTASPDYSRAGRTDGLSRVRGKAI